jgi:capsular polysaccharide transport system permease protein
MRNAKASNVALSSKLVDLAPVRESSSRIELNSALISRRGTRHKGIIASFVLCVLLPLGVTIWYLTQRAEDQFSSSTAFALRTEESVNGLELLSGFAAMSGSNSNDIEILDLFLTSQGLVSKVQSKIDLHEVWSQHYTRDPVFSFNSQGTIEDLTRYWQRMVSIDYDSGSGLIELTVKTFSPENSQRLTEIILAECTYLVNHLSDDAQRGTVQAAAREHEMAKNRLRDTRLAISALRMSTGMIDPEAGLSGDHGVIQSLQESLAEELVKQDLLRRNLLDSGQKSGTANDVRLSQSEIKIDVLQSRISQERQKFGTKEVEGYSKIIARFEELLVDQRFSEEAYVATTAALDAARAEARRISRHLAVFVQPTLAERSLFPRRFTISGTVAGFSILLWALFVLIYISARDRRAI